MTKYILIDKFTGKERAVDRELSRELRDRYGDVYGSLNLGDTDFTLIEYLDADFYGGDGSYGIADSCGNNMWLPDDDWEVRKMESEDGD